MSRILENYKRLKSQNMMQTDTVISHGKISRAKRRLHLFAHSARFLPPVVLPPHRESKCPKRLFRWWRCQEQPDFCQTNSIAPHLCQYLGIHLNKMCDSFACIFIGPRYTWGPIYGSRVSVTN